ncbi:Ig-like domain-containing protein [Geobacter sp. DSM 9736]|uniref:Ig-like domain-containing protein n=1 Tax=Geobacter sp. DSM 9736 TaxID=1277350 RepID=UPI000B4FDA6B|nr:Ig-like domain-containing protein [Geobacter sp. DSM 9736]SNB44960.1 hypothetical protein SAMN06269301_0352 [Geobacter sp. DSM 9736]
MAELTKKLLLALLIVAGGAHDAFALLGAVSGKPTAGTPNQLTEVLPGGNPADVATSLAHGFPIWYRDENGVKLELCLDKPAAGGNGIVIPCLTAEPFTNFPISFPANFGSEAFWWNATGVATFTSLDNGTSVPGGDMLVVMALEASFGNLLGTPEENQQVAFGRIRLRANVPVAGTYQLTHPYGTRDFVVPGVSAGREINQTQDLGIINPLDFTVALSDGPPPPAPPAPTPPSTDAQVVNADGLSVGPFLVPAVTPYNPVTRIGGPLTLGGATYIGEPGGAVHVEQALTAAPDAAPFGHSVTLTLLNPPAGFVLNSATGNQTVTISNFQVMGKRFNDGPNLRPTARPDSATTAMNRAVTIDAVLNDLDPVTGANVHGINRQALGLVAAGGEILRTTPVATANGGTVQRTTNLVTGKATFTYTPAAGFTGEDSFSYVVQDTGGLISEPVQVTVLVENLSASKAEFRPRTGTWRIEGTSSDTTSNLITIHGGPRAVLSGPTAAGGGIGLRVTDTEIAYRLTAEPLPSTVASIDIRLDTADGPAIFNLYDRDFDGAVTFPREGTLTTFNLQPRPNDGVSTFSDAVARILAGSAFLTVRTTARPTGTGEMSGRISRPVIGTAAVRPGGRWAFRGKSTASPGPFASVSITSSNGISAPTLPVRMR